MRPILELISQLWPSWKATEAIVALWTAELSQHDEERVAAAVLAHAKRSTWPPALADILAYLEPEGPSPESDLAAIDAYRRMCSDTSYDHSDNAGQRRMEARMAISVRGIDAARAVWGPSWASSEARMHPAARRDFRELWGHAESRDQRRDDMAAALECLPALWAPEALPEPTR